MRLSALAGGRPAPAAGATDATLSTGALVRWQDVRVLRRLGAGAFASVDLAAWTPAPGAAPRTVAVKRLHPNAEAFDGHVGDLFREVVALRALAASPARERFVGFVGAGVVSPPGGEEGEHVRLLAAPAGGSQRARGNVAHGSFFVVLEACKGGTLRSLLHRCMKGEHVYAGPQALRWATQLAEALAACHSSHPTLLFRDLKPANALLTDEPGSDACAIRLADFGLAKMQLSAEAARQAEAVLPAPPATCGQRHEVAPPPPPGPPPLSNVAMTERTGSHPYMAPEVWRGRHYGSEVDVFSLGMVMYELFSKCVLLSKYDVHNDERLELFVSRLHARSAPWRPPFGADVPAPLRALIRKCWAQDPAERPTAAEAAEALRRIERDASASSGAGLWHGSLQPRRPTPSVAAVASALTARVAEALLMAWRAIVRFCQGTQTQASRGRYERIEQVAEAV
uniref:Protein kinase domain-containing protein n=1 Tax=Prasinoderma singulare TaxID=676789 RepID=A0A7S3F525_9VIRI